MSRQFLDFEQPIAELQAKIEELRLVSDDSQVNISDEITRLEKKCDDLTKSIFTKLSPWQITQLARHPARPYTLDYIQRVFTDFDELHGDRYTSNGPAIVAGLARFQGAPVCVIGHQKGRNTKEKIARNFGMARPEEYRKALRVMKLAEKFQIPVITFIDTPGAYPGIGAEERNQSQAIALNLQEMAKLKTPIISIVIGEGGSGGALAIGVGDKLYMLEYSIYSVISPEGCATILWRTAEQAPTAAEAMKVTSSALHKHGLIDGIIKEPRGGAHRQIDTMAASITKVIKRDLAKLNALSTEALLASRFDRLMAYGRDS